MIDILWSEGCLLKTIKSSSRKWRSTTKPVWRARVIQMLDEAQVDPSSIGMDDVASPRPDLRAISHQGAEFVDVVGRPFRNS